MKNSKGKGRIQKNNPGPGKMATDSNKFGSSKGIPSPRRKHFGQPGSATKDKRHGVNESRSE